MFKGRNLLVATKHKKETVITPLLEENLGVYCFTSNVFDTDSLGTFTGEIERKHDALTTLRMKCDEAHKITNCDLIVASEGSFGPHPSIFFAHADDELVMLKDFKNDLEIVGREISLETNFNGALINNYDDLNEFIEKVSFPSHRVILKSSEKNFEKIYKGISSKELLVENFDELKNNYNSIYIETDMRAMHNPTRMKVIEKATQNLLQKINTKCPKCLTPGFDVIKANRGLPCENCYLPTKSTLSYVYQCVKCNYEEEKKYPRGIYFEDPTFCDNCNP